jgi:hypothetical protein
MSKITQEIVDKHRAKEAAVYILKVDTNATETEEEMEDSDIIPEDTKGIYYALLRKPGRKEIGFAMMQKTPLDIGDAFIKNCWIDGDEEIKDIAYQDTIGVVASTQAIKLMNIAQGSLKKL